MQGTIPTCPAIAANAKRKMTPRLESILLLAILVSIGCSKKDESVVTGTVTINGAPAAEGYITFIPADGKGTTPGSPIVDGKYSATISPGTKKVEIRVPKVVGQAEVIQYDRPVLQPITKEVLPAKYNVETELVLEVKPGENKEDYKLESRPNLDYP